MKKIAKLLAALLSIGCLACGAGSDQETNGGPVTPPLPEGPQKAISCPDNSKEWLTEVGDCVSAPEAVVNLTLDDTDHQFQLTQLDEPFRNRTVILYDGHRWEGGKAAPASVEIRFNFLHPQKKHLSMYELSATLPYAPSMAQSYDASQLHWELLEESGLHGRSHHPHEDVSVTGSIVITDATLIPRSATPAKSPGLDTVVVGSLKGEINIEGTFAMWWVNLDTWKSVEFNRTITVKGDFTLPVKEVPTAIE